MNFIGVFPGNIYNNLVDKEEKLTVNKAYAVK